MKKTTLLLAGVAALLALPGLIAVAAASDDASAETTVLTGEYRWVNMDGPGPLEMVLERTGDGTYDVLCHFKFQGRERTYHGTAEGSLEPEGELIGKMFNENERRTFIFEGSFSHDGSGFSAVHEETTPSRARRTGTLEVERASAP